jgi:hypothetical protein
MLSWRFWAATLRYEVKKQIANSKPKGPAGKRQRPTATRRTKSKVSLGAAQPATLTGGNPRIAKADGDAPVQAYIAAMPEWKRDVGRRLDALIRAAVALNTSGGKARPRRAK